MSETRLPISFQKNSFKDDVHHALYLRPLLLQLEEHEERHAEATQQVRHDTFTLASSLHRWRGTGLTSVIFFCILSCCTVLFCLSVFVFCTSYNFWLFSILALRLRATPTIELSSFTAYQGCPDQKVQISLLNVFTYMLVRVCVFIPYLLACRCVWRPAHKSWTAQWAVRWGCSSGNCQIWCCADTEPPAPTQSRRTRSGTSGRTVQIVSEDTPHCPTAERKHFKGQQWVEGWRDTGSIIW